MAIMALSTELPDSTRVGTAALRVTDLDRAVSFWRDVIGLPVLERGDAAILGFSGRPLISLHPGATGPMPDKAMGLFHVALQLDTRADLARVAARFAASGHRYSGQDHLLSESLYIADPDGNKIEITRFTPGRGTITEVDGSIRGVTSDGKPHTGLEPLDLGALSALLPPGDIGAGMMPDSVFIGHIHFRSHDLAAAFRFYSEVIGLRPNFYAPAWRFCDAGTALMPHMVALNTWAGDAVIPALPGDAGLIFYTLAVESFASFGAVRSRLQAAGIEFDDSPTGIACIDPDGNALRIVMTV